MSLCRVQIEHMERVTGGRSKSRSWLKKQMNKFIRLLPIEDTPTSKTGKKPMSGFEY